MKRSAYPGSGNLRGNSVKTGYKSSVKGNSYSLKDYSGTQFQNVGDASYSSGNKVYSSPPNTMSSMTDSTTDSNFHEDTVAAATESIDSNLNGDEEAKAESSSVNQVEEATITMLVIPLSTSTPFDPIAKASSSTVLLARSRQQQKVVRLGHLVTDYFHLYLLLS